MLQGYAGRDQLNHSYLYRAVGTFMGNNSIIKKIKIADGQESSKTQKLAVLTTNHKHYGL